MSTGNGLTRRAALLAGISLGIVGLTTFPAAAKPESDGVDYSGAEWIPADQQNYTPSDRPLSQSIDLIIIHVTQTTFADAVRMFQDPKHAASAHYAFRSNDGYLAQFVRERDIAWHAGNWDYNTRSIGIEHEGRVDQPSWFTDIMYRASAKLTAQLCRKYHIPVDRNHIIGHVEVPGTDHTDPGRYWDWNKYLTLVAHS